MCSDPTLATSLSLASEVVCVTATPSPIGMKQENGAGTRPEVDRAEKRRWKRGSGKEAEKERKNEQGWEGKQTEVKSHRQRQRGRQERGKKVGDQSRDGETVGLIMKTSVTDKEIEVGEVRRNC